LSAFGAAVKTEAAAGKKEKKKEKENGKKRKNLVECPWG
jgi:hypothetical protein